MILRSIYLQHFRSYKNTKFDFADTLTIIVGPNTAGKTNLAEAIHLLATGKSFKTSQDTNMIALGQEVGRVQGLLLEQPPQIIKHPSTSFALEALKVKVQDDKKEVAASQASLNDTIKEEVVIATAQATGGRFSKKFLLNGVGKARSSLFGLLPLVLFRPEELEIIIDGPALRRGFLDEVLEQVDKSYAAAKVSYDRALRQRNALLRNMQETPSTHFVGSATVRGQFAYWDDLLITNGQILTQKREAFLSFVTHAAHDIFPLQANYDASTISRERLDQYKNAEVAAGVTLVGPHRDDFFVYMPIGSEWKDVRHFGSRGQQRLAVLQLKMLQIAYVQQQTGKQPLLVLDDIFSELDSGHIQLVLHKVQGAQVILTTTHKEFVPAHVLRSAAVIELEKI